jgi:5-aminolevulinate synthase
MHPTHGSVVPGQRALTSPNGTFATDDNNCAAEAYERHFHDSLERLQGEQRYRIFADIERISRGQFAWVIA